MKKRLLITLLVLVGIVFGPYLPGIWICYLFEEKNATAPPPPIILIWVLGIIGLLLLVIVVSLIDDLIRWIKTGE